MELITPPSAYNSYPCLSGSYTKINGSLFGSLAGTEWENIQGNKKTKFSLWNWKGKIYWETFDHKKILCHAFFFTSYSTSVSHASFKSFACIQQINILTILFNCFYKLLSCYLLWSVMTLAFSSFFSSAVYNVALSHAVKTWLRENVEPICLSVLVSM